MVRYFQNHDRAAKISFPLLISLGLVAVFAAGSAHAARPFVTDDGRVVDAKSCQVESWVRFNRTNPEYWALPACNFTGNLELTAGGGLSKDANGRQITDWVFQGKTLFKTLEPNGWSIGLAGGLVLHPDIRPTSNLTGNFYAYIPASFSFRDDRMVLHTNLGWLQDRDTKENRVTWGVGTEILLTGNTWLVAESFGQNKGQPYYQAGIRQWIVPNRVQVDATYGNRFASGVQEQWFTIGLRLLSPRFLP